MPEWMTEDFIESVWFLPVRIVLIVAVAFVARAIAHRLIDRTVRRLVNGRVHPRQPRRAPKAVQAMAKAAPFTVARREQRIGALGSLGRSAVSVVLLVIVALMVLSELGFNIAALLAGTSLVGIAIAFGVQTILRDVISGIFMLIEDQLGMGDYVQVADIDGVVEEVGLRLTQIRDGDGTIWYIRNGEIAKIANYSQGNGSGRPTATGTAHEDPGALAREVTNG